MMFAAASMLALCCRDAISVAAVASRWSCRARILSIAADRVSPRDINALSSVSNTAYSWSAITRIKYIAWKSITPPMITHTIVPPTATPVLPYQIHNTAITMSTGSSIIVAYLDLATSHSTYTSRDGLSYISTPHCGPANTENRSAIYWARQKRESKTFRSRL